MAKSDLGRLSADWKGIDCVVPYGAGIVGGICKSLFRLVDLEIPFVIDRDPAKRGQTWLNAPVMPFEEAAAHLAGKKLVVMAGHTAYGKIAAYLAEHGLTEFKDFCNVGHFMSEWLWDARGMNAVFHVDMTITTRCTLNCRHCNLFMPYQKEKIHFKLDDLKRNIDLFFQRIDFVTYFGLIGGETFLHPGLEELIVYLGENYRQQIGRITVVTNGTVTPSDSLLAAIRKYEMYLSISDYTSAVNYEAKMNSLVDRAARLGIDYSRNRNIVWTDFGFPEAPYRRSPAELSSHLAACRPNWNALRDGKFYYCNCSCCAELTGNYTLKPDDFIDLEKINPQDKNACRQIVRLSRGTSSFCHICGGCGADNTNYVPTGGQMA